MAHTAARTLSPAAIAPRPPTLARKYARGREGNTARGQRAGRPSCFGLHGAGGRGGSDGMGCLGAVEDGAERGGEGGGVEGGLQ